LEQTVLITGAAGGFGYEFSRLFAENSYNLVLVDIDEDNLESVARELESGFQIKVHRIICDLAEPDAAIKVFNSVKENELTINILVNNAGFGDFGFFHNTDWEKEKCMLQLNMITLTQLSKLFLKEMIKSNSGKILNIASVAAFQPGPLMALYFASKAYILSFSESIANEARGTGVSVTVLCPGTSKTGFQKAAGHINSNLVKKKLILNSPEFVARYGYQALMRGKTVAIPGRLNYFLVNLSRILPRNLVTRIVRKVQEKQLNQKPE